MYRKEFLSAIGFTAASFALINCVGCSKESDNEASGVNGPSGVEFTLDLSASANAVLLANGGYLAANGVIVAKTTAGTYIAVQQSCTHESYPLIYQGGSQQYYCNNHGSAFTKAGVVKNSPANHNINRNVAEGVLLKNKANETINYLSFPIYNQSRHMAR